MIFSVIIPLYNKAPYVAKAIGSVLAQNFTDYELVIVDDGSKDNSAEIAAQAIEGQSNCRIIRQVNTGVSVARNNGVKAAHGDYICFLDADDWWEPTFLEEMSKLIKEFPDAGIYGTSYTIVNETKRKTRVSPIGVESDFIKGYINYCQVYAKTLAMPLTSISVAIPRVIYNEFEGFPKGIKLGEDFLLWIRIALKYKVAFLNRPLAYYNQDVETADRGTGRLHRPEDHMLWNLDFLAAEEARNTEYKHLIDRLRIYGLLPYFLSKDYHKTAAGEIAKVDWSGQPRSAYRQYHTPRILGYAKYRFMKWGSMAKTVVKNLMHL